MRRPSAPPPPTVEDERDSLSKELASVQGSNHGEASEGQPPERGLPEQQPIIRTVNDGVDAGSSLETRPNDVAERRFVHLTRSTSTSDLAGDGTQEVRQHSGRESSSNRGRTSNGRAVQDRRRRSPAMHPIDTTVIGSPNSAEAKEASPRVSPRPSNRRAVTETGPISASTFLSPDTYTSPAPFAQRPRNLPSPQGSDHEDAINDDTHSDGSTRPDSQATRRSGRYSFVKRSASHEMGPRRMTADPDVEARPPIRERRRSGRRIYVHPGEDSGVNPKSNRKFDTASADESVIESGSGSDRRRSSRYSFVKPDKPTDVARETSSTAPIATAYRDNAKTKHQMDRSRRDSGKSFGSPPHSHGSYRPRSRGSSPSASARKAPSSPREPLHAGGHRSTLASVEPLTSLDGTKASGSRPGSRAGSSSGSRPSSPVYPSPPRSPRPTAPSALRKDPLASSEKPGLKMNSSPVIAQMPSHWLSHQPRTAQQPRMAPEPWTSDHRGQSTPPPPYSGPRIDLVSPGSHHRLPQYASGDLGNRISPSLEAEIKAPGVSKTRQTSSASGHHRAEVDVAPLPPCPRSSFRRGFNDWYTLVGFPNFDMCPSCWASVVEPSPYRSSFTAAPARAPQAAIRCDFSQPWVRMAWLLTVKRQMPNLSLLYGIANIISMEPCPGSIEAFRSWYGIGNPESGKPIRNFDACSACVKCLECLWPSLGGVFEPSPNGPRRSLCALRSDGKRFMGYLVQLEAVAEKAETSRSAPVAAGFANYVKRRVSMRECSQGEFVYAQAWHTMPELPDFTVCEECYHDVVASAASSGSELAKRFNRSLQYVGPPDYGVVCHLWSDPMRNVFVEAVRRNSLDFLNAKWREIMRVADTSAYNAGRIWEPKGQMGHVQSPRNNGQLSPWPPSSPMAIPRPDLSSSSHGRSRARSRTRERSRSRSRDRGRGRDWVGPLVGAALGAALGDFSFLM
ncbi:MAG: hypothetical protein M1817_004737 [Caeruleum heppii]|nr:MAG: hypothetical protein M1817_004737 [Caeruleum heppii]